MFIKGIQRPIAATVLVTFVSLVLQPLAVLAQDRPTGNRSATRSETGEERFSRTLNEIHEILKELVPQAAMPHMFAGKPGEKQLRAIGPKLLIETEAPKPLPGVDLGKKVKELRAKTKELLALEGEVRRGFDATAKHIKDKSLPPEILARHDDAVRAYEARSAEFKALVNAVETAGDAGPALDSALANLGAFMAKYPNEKTHTPSDPHKLPWGSPKPIQRAPYTKPEQFKTSGLFDELYAEQLAKALKRKPLKLAQAGGLSGIGLPSATLPATPEPADLAPTEDVQITQAIRGLAASLGNQPVAIYNWVRNNVEFVPSYGSIQGSDMTLQSKRGNAFDTCSLLIALFRAANIPARYVYGTVNVPADKAMNWVGGVTVPDAAQNLMGQGGIPNLGIAEAGRVKWIQLEHVWVEAYVDYVPSRGAVHRQGDTWVPVDASFKQYQFTQGMDIKRNVPFDAPAFLSQVQQGSTVNEQEGWVRNINQTIVLEAFSSHQAHVTSYVNSQKANATVGDVLGTRTIVQDDAAILYGTLPYPVLAVGAVFQAIPANLRWQFRYSLYSNEFDRALENALASLAQSTPRLAGKKITLSYSPATPADQETINGFLPRPHADGSPLQLSELPQSFPAYLIRLTPELRVEGQVVATGPALVMGTELTQNAAYFNPVSGQWEAGEDNRLVIGEYIATALDLQGVGAEHAAGLLSRIRATKAKLDQFQQNPADAAPLQTLVKDEIAGDALYSTMLLYFATIDRTAHLTANASGVVQARMPSYGNFGVAARVQLFFGFPRSVRFAGVQIDVDRIVGIEASKDANNAPVVTYRQAVGSQYSANEHLVPERVFTDLSNPNRPRGLSAVRLLAIAGERGQRIFTLDSRNQPTHASVLAQLGVSADVKSEISNALAGGKRVTVHESNLTAEGFTGAGYIILDPATGAGAYKISGGASGGMLLILLGLLLAILMVALAFVTGGVGVLFYIGLVAGLAANSFIVWQLDPLDAGEFGAARVLIVILAAVLLVLNGFIVGGAVVGTVLFALFIGVVLVVRAIIESLSWYRGIPVAWRTRVQI